MKRHGLVLTFLAVAAFGIARADDLPDAATLRTRTQAAARTPDQWSETERYSSASRSGERRLYVSGNDIRTITIDDGIETQRGVYHGASWHRTANGVTVTEASPTAAPATTAPQPPASVIHDPENTNRYILSALDRRGFGTRDWIDARTYSVVRHEVITPNGDITTDYDDFRDVGGARPFHWVVHDEITRETRDYRRVAFEIGHVRAQDVVIPETRPFMTFAGGSSAPVELPVRWTDDAVSVDVTIGIKTYRFLLDSGAGGIFVDPAVAAELGLPLHGEHSTVVAGRYTTGNVVVPEMRVGSIVLHDTVAGIAPQPDFDGHRAEDGILGFDFIAGLGLSIDYQARRIVAMPSAAYHPPENAEALDVDLTRDVPFTLVSVNGSPGNRFFFDTGSPLALVIFDRFALAHPGAVARAPLRPQPLLEGYGVGGKFDVKPIHIAAMRVGPYRLTDVAGYRLPGDAGFRAFTDGMVGTGFLSLFTVDFDLQHAKVYLRPNDRGRTHVEVTQ